MFRVLRSDWLTQGPTVPKFERRIAELLGSKEVVAVSNATSGLHLSCLALGVSSKDIVWSTAVSFVASANCARYCGAKVDFVDIDPATHNMCAKALQEKLESVKSVVDLPKVVVVVHMAGYPADLLEINQLSRRYGFKVLEDASHAFGSFYRGERVGNCRYSDLTVFSFHPVKSITTAEGGAICTNDPELANRLRSLRSHGINRSAGSSNTRGGDWYYQQEVLGFNYRMSDVHAAIGISQVNRIDKFVKRRKKIAEIYNEGLTSLPISLPVESPDRSSSWHLYIVRLNDRFSAEHHVQIFNKLRACNIGVALHYIPIFLHPFHLNEMARDSCPNSMNYYHSAISLPIFPSLAKFDQDTVIACMNDVIQD